LLSVILSNEEMEQLKNLPRKHVDPASQVSSTYSHTKFPVDFVCVSPPPGPV